MQEQNIIPTDAKWASVIISAPVKPDEFMAVAASYDKTLRYGAQTPFNDQLESHWEGGKWEVDATHDSIITAGNGGDKPAQAQVTLFFNGGTGKYQIEQTLAPDQQLWLDLGRLIRDRVPDKNGNTLPSDLTSGTYQFRDLTQSPGSSLFEELRTHILKRVFERNFFCNSHSIMGDAWRAKLLVKRYVAISANANRRRNRQL